MSDKLVRIKNRYDSAINWSTENPVLAAGEIGIDSTNKIIKVGNGSSNWNEMSPINHKRWCAIYDSRTRNPSVGISGIPISFCHKSSGPEYLMSGQYMLTIEIRGYFSRRMLFDNTYFEAIDGDNSFTMDFIPLTDANITSDNMPQLQVEVHPNLNENTIALFISGPDNNNIDNTVLDLDIQDEGIAMIKNDIVMIFEQLW